MIFIMYSQLSVNIADEAAFDVLRRRLVCSLYWMFSGKWPTRDDKGTPIAGGGGPLAGGFYAQLWVLRADLDELSKTYGFNYCTSATPCNCCRANIRDAETPWTDGRPTAAWLATVWKPQELLAAHPNRHPLFTLPGVTIRNYVPDVMHTLHPGVFQWIFGSISSC